jgi:hypothetical protein
MTTDKTDGRLSTASALRVTQGLGADRYCNGGGEAVLGGSARGRGNRLINREMATHKQTNCTDVFMTRTSYSTAVHLGSFPVLCTLLGQARST